MEIGLLWVAAMIVSTVIGSNKGRGLLGFTLGFLLGWIGVIIMLFVNESQEHRIQRYREENEARQAALWQPPRGPMH